MKRNVYFYTDGDRFWSQKGTLVDDFFAAVLSGGFGIDLSTATPASSVTMLLNMTPVSLFIPFIHLRQYVVWAAMMMAGRRCVVCRPMSPTERFVRVAEQAEVDPCAKP